MREAVSCQEAFLPQQKFKAYTSLASTEKQSMFNALSDVDAVVDAYYVYPLCHLFILVLSEVLPKIESKLQTPSS